MIDPDDFGKREYVTVVAGVLLAIIMLWIVFTPAA